MFNPGWVLLETDISIHSIKTFNGSKAPCFPCAVGVASTWDVGLLREIGQEMGRQAKTKGVQYVLRALLLVLFTSLTVPLQSRSGTHSQYT
mgnify:CR=1 FL=1